MEPFIERPVCEICKSTNYQNIVSIDFIDSKISKFIGEYYCNRIPKDYLTQNKFEVVKCNSCGFIWQRFILNDELNNRLYNEWISSTDSISKKKYADFNFFNNYYKEIKTINSLIPKKPNDAKLLDYGMGWGYWCLMAKAFGYDVYGYEISPERIEYAERNGVQIINRLDEEKSDTYDFINAEQVFEHIKEPLKVLKSLLRLLKPGGFIRISVPNGNYLENKISKPQWIASHDEIHPLEHINCFTTVSINKMTEKADLIPIYNPRITNNTFNNIIKLLFTKTKYFDRFKFPKYFKKIEDN